jgi:hypothetical protein
MTTLPSTDEALTWIGLPVRDAAGAELGTCRNVYADDDTGVPEWVEVTLAEGDDAFVPTLGASATDGALRVGQPVDLVSRSPRFTSDVDLDPDAERALYAHYGIEPSRERSDTLLPAGVDLPGDGASREPAPARTARLRRLEKAAAPSPTPTPTVTPTPTAAPTPKPVVTPVPPPPASSGRPSWLPAVALAAVPVAGVVGERLLARRRAQQEVQQRAVLGGATLLPLLALAGGLLAWRRRSSRRDVEVTDVEVTEVAVVEVGPVPAMPSVVDLTEPAPY